MSHILQYIAPHKLLSKIANLMANCKVPWIKNILINYFLGKYDVNLSEAIESDPKKYESFNAFFTRKLKPGSREIINSPTSIISPSDGYISQAGVIENKKIIQAKGMDYYFYDLLADHIDNVRNFENGSYCTIYLAPKDYHRVHMPFSGKLTNMRYVPGKLFSVNINTSENIPNLFARNERVVSYFDTEFGKMAVVLVGAMIVGGIDTAWSGTVSPPHYKNIINHDYHDIFLDKAEELGKFNLGSTVILLFEKDKINLNQNIVGRDIKMGQEIATLKT